MSAPDLVTVVVPAFNASRTIDQTLCSVRSQTHRRLEIFVVDDGSNDATPQIVERHGAEDRRVHLIQQPHLAVAAARNRGIAEATGDLVAPIDADDLWRPEKIEKQLAALRLGGVTVALVYTWSAIIDVHGRIIVAIPGARHTGTVINQICRGNFIGNGSSVLMRKAAVLEAGGYDPSLRSCSAQGLEDWQLYFRIATRHEFSMVPEHLTGYRRMRVSMSADVLQMLRSRDLLAAEMSSIYPEWTSEIAGDRLYFLANYLYHHSLGTGRSMNALLVAALAVRQSPYEGSRRVLLIPARALARVVSRRLAHAMRRHGGLRADDRRFPIGTPVGDGS